MDKQGFSAVVCACALLVLASPVTAATINYSSTANSQVDLDPTDNCGGAGTVGCFDFSPGTNLEISSGTAIGLAGSITGTFGVGTITPGFLESANVTGTGTLTILDGLTPLTANLDWLNINTVGVAGILNISGNVNLTSITYGGTDADLLALANAGSGIQTATFQFTSPQSLTDLFETSSTVSSTSFSGSISAVPVPAAIWLFGSGLLGLVGIARRKLS